MIIRIELCEGRERRPPTKKGIQKDMDALERAIRDNKQAGDNNLNNLLMDALSILEAIQKQL